MKTCIHCNSSIRDEVVFCTVCGKRQDEKPHTSEGKPNKFITKTKNFLSNSKLYTKSITALFTSILILLFVFFSSYGYFDYAEQHNTFNINLLSILNGNARDYFDVIYNYFNYDFSTGHFVIYAVLIIGCAICSIVFAFKSFFNSLTSLIKGEDKPLTSLIISLVSFFALPTITNLLFPLCTYNFLSSFFLVLICITFFGIWHVVYPLSEKRLYTRYETIRLILYSFIIIFNLIAICNIALSNVFSSYGDESINNLIFLKRGYFIVCLFAIIVTVFNIFTTLYLFKDAFVEPDKKHQNLSIINYALSASLFVILLIISFVESKSISAATYSYFILSTLAFVLNIITQKIFTTK